MTPAQIKARNAKPEYQANLKAWRKANRPRINLLARLRRYGLTETMFVQMQKVQNHLCKVCLGPFK